MQDRKTSIKCRQHLKAKKVGCCQEKGLACSRSLKTSESFIAHLKKKEEDKDESRKETDFFCWILLESMMKVCKQ